MTKNQISPFEYISILISIIIGKGIMQILSTFSSITVLVFEKILGSYTYIFDKCKLPDI
jgi:hypothetical protein